MDPPSRVAKTGHASECHVLVLPSTHSGMNVLLLHALIGVVTIYQFRAISFLINSTFFVSLISAPPSIVSTLG